MRKSSSDHKSTLVELKLFMMNPAVENKGLIYSFHNELSGKLKTKASCLKYTIDIHLINHMLFFDGLFPKFHIHTDSLIGEGEIVVANVRITGIHKGLYKDLIPSYREIEFSYIIYYYIDNDKIIKHEIIGDHNQLLMQILDSDKVLGYNNHNNSKKKILPRNRSMMIAHV